MYERREHRPHAFLSGTSFPNVVQIPPLTALKQRATRYGRGRGPWRVPSCDCNHLEPNDQNLNSSLKPQCPQPSLGFGYQWLHYRSHATLPYIAIARYGKKSSWFIRFHTQKPSLTCVSSLLWATRLPSLATDRQGHLHARWPALKPLKGITAAFRQPSNLPKPNMESEQLFVNIFRLGRRRACGDRRRSTRERPSVPKENQRHCDQRIH